MSEMKSLADQLRSKMAKPDTPVSDPPKKKQAVKATTHEILETLRAFNIAGNKSLVHARFDAQTAQMLHHFKMATGIEVTRLLCYAVKQLLEKHPEIKSIIKDHLEKLEL
jgi:hypothetical protein